MMQQWQESRRIKSGPLLPHNNYICTNASYSSDLTLPSFSLCREALAGHDGTWVAHPNLVSVAKSVFDNYMPTPNQIGRNPGLAGKDVTEADLLKLPEVPKGEAITSDGLQKG